MAKDLKDKRQNEVYNAKTMIKIFKKNPKKHRIFSVVKTKKKTGRDKGYDKWYISMIV